MPAPTSSNGSAGVNPARQSAIPGEEEPHARLQALFAEATALANQLRKVVVQGPRQQGFSAGGCGIAQVLDRLGPLTVPGIARTRALSRQSVQTLVNRLASRGYVALTANPAHKRSGLVHLTGAGRALLATVQEREADSLADLMPQVPQAQLLPATRLLRRLRLSLSGNLRLVDEMPPKRPTSKRTRPRRRLARETKPHPAAVEPLEATAHDEPGESEFPVNLL